MSAVSFIFLGAAILAVWWPSATRIRPWTILFAAALGCGLVGEIVTPAALPGLAFLILACLASVQCFPKAGRGAAGVFALILALHAWPGFHPLTIVDNVVLSPGALPFTLRASFDKAAAGLLLLAFFSQRCRSLAEIHRNFGKLLLFSGFGALSTIGLAWLAGYVRSDLKWPAFASHFVAINLLFTCVAEECFFRGLIQEKLHELCSKWGKIVPITLSAALFGTAHLAGGALYAGLAGVAGFTYAWAYACTRRIETAIFVHFIVNLTHFIGFSYPGLSS